jgi:hypothetical protein
MNVRSLKLAGAAASTLLLSVIPSQAFAQTPFDVLTGTTISSFMNPGTSTYKFTGSMILNSIGFVTNDYPPVSMSYTLKGTTYNVTESNLSEEENGFRWLTLSPQSMVADDIVTVSSHFYIGFPVSAVRASVTPPSSSTNVTYEGFFGSGSGPSAGQTSEFTNSNLRVSPSNPGSNVAPEPGSIALLLTGGGALAGIALRRRRNAS